MRRCGCTRAKRAQAVAGAAVVHTESRREFVAAMGDVLKPYAEPYDPDRPVVCFDETSTQLLANIGEPLPAQPGGPRPEDYEYRRAVTRNLSLTCGPRRRWRQVEIDQRHTTQDFARSAEVAGGRGLSRCPSGPARSGQLEHPWQGISVRDLSAIGGPAHPQEAGVPPHSQAWELAEYDGD